MRIPTKTALAACLLAAALPVVHAGEKPYGVDREFTAAEYAAHNAHLARFEGYDTPPQLLKGYVPLYPAGSLRARRTGHCVVTYSVETDGRVGEAFGSPQDDKAMCDHAVLALREWRFAPALQDGKPVRAMMRVPISYDLR